MSNLRDILQDIRPDIDFETETALVSDGILDSLDIVNIVTRVESDLDAQISFMDLVPENLDSLEAITALVERSRA